MTGWAAGLQLAALSLRGRTDADAFVAAFSGSHRYVLDYLAEEVLDRQEPGVREFLLTTSVLDRLSGDLCEAVTGRPDSQAMLERIERAGLFIVPLDEVRGWWRYHHLFRDLLRAILYSERIQLTPSLHRAAAAWHAAHGMADEGEPMLRLLALVSRTCSPSWGRATGPKRWSVPASSDCLAERHCPPSGRGQRCQALSSTPLSA